MNWNTVLSILIIIFVFVAVLISADVVFLKKEKCLGLIKRDWVIIIHSLIAVLYFTQLILNNHNTEISKQNAVEEQNDRDSILKEEYKTSLLEMKNKYDAANNNTIKTISSALGNYGYRLDTTSQLLEKLKDSIKTTIILPELPVLRLRKGDGITPIGKNEGGKYGYQLWFESDISSTCDINIIIYCVISDSLNNKELYRERYVVEPKIIISKGEAFSIKYWIESNYKPYWVHFYFTGTYKNDRRTETLSIDWLYGYNVKTKETIVFAGSTRKEILDMISQMSIEKYDP